MNFAYCHLVVCVVLPVTKPVVWTAKSALRLSLSQSPSALSLAVSEHSLAAQESLAALMSVVRARRNSDFTLDRQKLEATLRATLLYVDEANAMAHALGHEVIGRSFVYVCDNVMLM